MAWAQYRDWLLHGNVSGAGIYGKDGSAWSVSANFTVSQSDVKKLLMCFVENSPRVDAIFIGEDRYMNISAPDDRNVARFSGPTNHRELQQNLLLVQQTNLTLIAAFSSTANECRNDLVKNLEQVYKHLTDNGY